MSNVSYGVKIKNLTNSLAPTIKIYREAVNYLVNISLLHYDDIKELSTNQAMSVIEQLVHGTANRMARYQKFDQMFYKMPSYLIRNAIVTANAKVDSYKKLVALWTADGCKGQKPKLNRTQNVMPCFYKDNMFICRGNRFAIKVYKKNDWVWQDIVLRKTDLDYIEKNCKGLKESAPVLVRRNRGYELRFAYKLPPSEKKYVKDVNVKKVVGVDLGLNKDAVCSVVRSDGTVVGQKFINCPIEKDRLYTSLNRVRKCYSKGNYKCKKMWRFVDNYNHAIAVKTAVEIVRYAKESRVDVIVFENLSSLKASGSRIGKQRIALWRKREIQHRTEEMAKWFGIRVAYVCPYGTSRLAFDGSGTVVRGRNAGYHNNEMCRFPGKKQYHCDLSAARNIAARFILRCKEKSMSEKVWLQAQTKVSELCTRTKCTLATVIRLSAVVAAS